MKLTEYNQREMARELHALKMRYGCDQRAAVARMIEALTDDQIIQLVRGDFGTWALLEAERTNLHGSRLPAPANTGLNRRAVGLLVSDPMRCEVAVGNTGRRVALGDLTAADIVVIYRQYDAASNTLRLKAKGWRSVARKLNPTERLEDALVRLSELDREFLAHEMGVKEIAA